MTGQVRPRTRRAAWLEIDLDAMRHNVALIRSLVGSAAVTPVVKADAYGHGMAATARALADVTDAFCVATLDEAIALREVVAGRIVVLYPVPEAAVGDAIAARVELTIMSAADLRRLQEASSRARGPVDMQLCVETGMGRGGVPPEEVGPMAAAVHADARLRLAGLWSHLASPEDQADAAAQVERFERASRALVDAGVPLPARHLAASGAIFAATAPPLETVRPGLAVYGVLDEALPIAAVARSAASGLRPALALKARPAAISEIPVGGGVGYGGRWRAQRPSRVAILPVGYGDGYLRGSQPGAEALVRGTRLPLVGVISMDAVAVDITDMPAVGHADDFTLLGRQGHESISAGDLARARNTIAWEVLSGMAARLERVYYPQAGPAQADEPPTRMSRRCRARREMAHRAGPR